jgi:hypothetical protein
VLARIDGIARKIIPHNIPEANELKVPPAIKKHMPTPTLVSVTIETPIDIVDGKATLRIKL